MFSCRRTGDGVGRSASVKPLIATALMIVPLLIVAVITWWPAEPVAVSTVLIPPTDVHSPQDISGPADEIPAVLSSHLKEIPGLQVHVAERNVDPAQAAGFDVVILTTLTEDAGIFQLNVQAVRPQTRKEIWSNAYHSSREQYREMLSAAGEGLRRALNYR